MPPSDDPSARPCRILVAGVAGVGKTTLARHVAAILDVPHTELDSLFHGPGWTPRPEFVDDVHALVASDAWVTEFQYRAIYPVLLERAQLLVWMDLPTHVVMRQADAPHVIVVRLRSRAEVDRWVARLGHA